MILIVLRQLNFLYNIQQMYGNQKEKEIVTCGDFKFKKLFPEEDILNSISSIADKINEIYGAILKDDPTSKIIFVGLLNGAFMFMSDLVKKIAFPIFIQFLKVKSYKGTESTQLTIQTNIQLQYFHNTHLIIVDDICDTGKTLVALANKLKQFGPKSIRTAVLMNRPDKQHELEPDFIGLQCSQFIVGYGLDYNLMGRQYSSIYEKVSSD